MSHLANKQILLGVTGGIAAYKSPELVRRLREAGALVRVVMTENAKRFITPLTMQAVSGQPICDDLFDLQREAAMGHIELARWADLILIAPATADCMAHLAHGFAEDLLTTVCLASRAPVVLAPSMNQGMWRHRTTEENSELLKQKGMHILEPTEGSQACGDVGPGRMMEPITIVEKISEFFKTNLLPGYRVLITAGPTHEAIDPIRFITNKSSGKMGYALATASVEAGARVTLVSGPTALSKPSHTNIISVMSAKQMYEAVMAEIKNCDLFFAVAAVSDYYPEVIAEQKIHKEEEAMQLLLVRTPDIVKSVGELKDRPFIVGFAAETEAVIENARAKRERKKMDMIVANHISEGVGMGSDENEVTVILEKGEIIFKRQAKHQLARQLITVIAEEFKRCRS